MPTPLDHLLVAILVVVLPLEGVLEFRELIGALRAGDPRARSRALIRTIALQWLLALALLAGWLSARRPWTELGLRVVGGLSAVAGMVAVVLAAGFMIAQHRAIARLSPERRQRLIQRSGDKLRLLPTTRGERRLFAATAVTAGTCEELLYRGFVFWYLAHWMDRDAFVLVGCVLFAAGHAYQGWKGAIQAGVGALLLGALYAFTGSLLWPMIVHATIDLAAGALGGLLSPSSRTDGAEPEPAAAATPV